MTAPRTLAVALAAALACATGACAQSQSLVDTGPGGPAGAGWSLSGDPQNPTSLAATFELGADARIGAVFAWMQVFATGGGLRIELHDGGTPNAPLLHSAWVSPAPTADVGWHGGGGFDWQVHAGTYTVAFVALSGFEAALPSASVKPLATEWFADRWSAEHFPASGWAVGDFLDLGLRIEAVPEPATWGLFGAGLLLTAGAAARRRAAS